MKGTQHEAFIYSLGANATHGKRRTNADKRRAVERALHDEALRRYSDRRLAQMCKVSNRFVSGVRQDLEISGEIPFEAELVSADGSLYERLDGPPSARRGPGLSSLMADPSPEELPTSRPAPRQEQEAKKQRAAPPSTQGDPTKEGSCILLYTSDVMSGLSSYQHAADHIDRLIAPCPDDLTTSIAMTRDIHSTFSSKLRGPFPVYVRDHDRIYLVWSTQRDDLPVSCSSQELVHHTTPILVGTPLESW